MLLSPIRYNQHVPMLPDVEPRELTLSNLWDVTFALLRVSRETAQPALAQRVWNAAMAIRHHVASTPELRAEFVTALARAIRCSIAEDALDFADILGGFEEAAPSLAELALDWLEDPTAFLQTLPLPTRDERDEEPLDRAHWVDVLSRLGREFGSWYVDDHSVSVRVRERLRAALSLAGAP